MGQYRTALLLAIDAESAQPVEGPSDATTSNSRSVAEKLLSSLQEARDSIADWGAYVDDYFQRKHNLVGELARINQEIEHGRAAPAQPVEAPSDDEIINQAITVGLAFQPRDDVQEVYLPFAADEDPLDDLLIKFARAMLARYGNSSTTQS